MYYKYSIVTLLGMLFFIHTAIAVEVVIETEPAGKTEQRKPASQRKKAQTVSIDALVAAYETASEEEAYKILNQIKQEIARMSRQRQASAIEKVRRSAEEKSKLPVKHTVPQEKKVNKKKQRAQKKKRQVRNHKKKREIKYKVHKKRKSKAARAISSHSHGTAHPDPLFIMNGATGATSSKGGSSGGAGGMGGF